MMHVSMLQLGTLFFVLMTGRINAYDYIAAVILHLGPHVSLRHLALITHSFQCLSTHAHPQQYRAVVSAPVPSSPNHDGKTVLSSPAAAPLPPDDDAAGANPATARLPFAKPEKEPCHCPYSQPPSCSCCCCPFEQENCPPHV